jgi:hypothetical protein
MRKFLWLAMAAVPFHAVAEVNDPVARPCYYCTPDEMSERARSFGPGEHYVYSAAGSTNIQGYRVTEAHGQRVAEHFVPAAWIRTQYTEMMRLYNQSRGEFVDEWNSLSLQPPGSPHVLSVTDFVMWGHHVAGVHPQHKEAREIFSRLLNNTSRFSYLKADKEHGRVLRFEAQQDGRTPLIIRLKSGYAALGFVEYFFDHDSKRWEYLESGDVYNRMQERPEDFLSADGGPRSFRYPYTYYEVQPYFIKRAEFAGVNVIGQLPVRSDVMFNCSRVGEQIQCRIN